jgi:hypothetical protein
MTARRFVHVGFNFGESKPPLSELEKLFNGAQDWMRYRDTCWILRTGRKLDDWRDRIRKTVSPETSFLLVEFDHRADAGYMQQWVWDWLNKYEPVNGPK